MRQKAAFVMTGILVLSFIFGGCSSGGKNVQQNMDTPKQETVSETQVNEEEETEKEESYKIICGLQNTEDAATGKGWAKFKELVEEKSGGRIVCEIHYGGSLGGQSDCLQAMNMGTIQMAEITTSTLTSQSDAFVIFDLPYLIQSVDSLKESIFDKGAGEILAGRLEEASNQKLSVLGWMCLSARNVYSSKGPIQSLDDFKGLKIRTMESNSMIDAFERLGASPTPIASNERYLALQTGVVDAAENILTYLISCKDYEVTKYVSLTRHIFTVNTMTVDYTWFQGLPEDIQMIIREASVEAAAFASDMEKQDDENAIAQLEELGMQVNEVQDLESIRSSVKSMYEDYKPVIGEELYQVFAE